MREILAANERALAPWYATLAELRKYDTTEDDVEAVLGSWDDDLLAHQASALARALAKKYREALDIAQDLAHVEDQRSTPVAPLPALPDPTFLRERIPVLDTLAGSSRRAPVRKLRRWIGERAVKLYDLLATRVPPQRRQARGARAPAFNMRAIKLTVKTLNTHPDFHGDLALELIPADLKSRLQKRGRKAIR